MLTVYSTQGSPGASLTALHLAAHWASGGREVLLIEADPAGGSLSHNLGIQFTPGLASFVASGLPVQSNHLIDQAQDVLFESLHVMPMPASPTGARGIFNAFADHSEELRTISENEMAVIIDGGQITADTAASALTTAAAGVVVVCREASQLSSLEMLRDAISADPGGDGPAGCAVSVGKSPMSPQEWEQDWGLTFCGSVEDMPAMAADLSTHLGPAKRKSKKWRASLEQIAESLYGYAQPPVSSRPRARTAEPPQTPDFEPDNDAGAATPAPAAPEPPAWDPAAHGHAPPVVPAAGAGYGQSHYLPPAAESQPAYQQPHYLPSTEWPGHPHGHGEAQPAAFPAYGHAPPPPYPPDQQPPQPYEQVPPAAYQQPPQPYEQPPQPYEQPPHEQTPPGQLPAQPPHEQKPPGQLPAQPPHEQKPPVPAGHSSAAAPLPTTADTGAVPRPNIQPTGSFRDWALKLHGADAEDMTADRGG